MNTAQQIREELKKIPFVQTQAPQGALKVLIVDDNETAADSLGQLLALHGYEVEIAYHGKSGFEKARMFHPQVAILDIDMPGMNGYELVGLLRSEKFSCTYIALTGCGQPGDKEKALLAGFDHHLTKPSRIKDIDALLQQVARETKKQ